MLERDTFLYKARRRCQAAAQKVLPDRALSRFYSRVLLGKWPDLKDPKTFNEKLQWMKLYYYPFDPMVVNGADKLKSREIAASRGVSCASVPIIGVWENAEEIDFQALPKSFVLKCNHGCAYNIAVPDKEALDKPAAVKQLNRWLKEDFGVFNIEPHYSKIKERRVFCEEYLGEKLIDYKFFCFNGVPKFIYVSEDMYHDRLTRMGFFELDGSKIDIQRDDYKDLESIELPPYFGDMLEDAKKLCIGYVFVRVDFFIGNGTYYFAELTFTPGAAMIPFKPERFDEEWGKLLDISEVMRKYGK
jgi:hypothetical protein